MIYTKELIKGKRNIVVGYSAKLYECKLFGLNECKWYRVEYYKDGVFDHKDWVDTKHKSNYLYNSWVNNSQSTRRRSVYFKV